MTDALDREIKSLVVELVESSPPPRPAESVLPKVDSRQSLVPLRSGLVRMAVVAMLVLAAGIAGALIGHNILPPAEVADPHVVPGDPAPEPLFSTDEYGEEVRLLPTTSEPVVLDDGEVTLDGDVVAVGRIEGSDVEVFTWNTTGPAELLGSCLQVVTPGGRDQTCSSELESPAETRESAFGISRVDVGVVALWRVPEGTSIVIVEAGDIRLWQRPVGGIAALLFDSEIPVVMMGALTAEGDLIRGTGLSPSQVGPTR